MKVNQLSRWAELWCVINGHDFNEHKWEKEDNEVMEHITTCGNCGISIVDESGRLGKAMRIYGGINA